MPDAEEVREGRRAEWWPSFLLLAFLLIFVLCASRKGGVSVTLGPACHWVQGDRIACLGGGEVWGFAFNILVGSLLAG